MMGGAEGGEGSRNRAVAGVGAGERSVTREQSNAKVAGGRMYRWKDVQNRNGRNGGCGEGWWKKHEAPWLTINAVRSTLNHPSDAMLSAARLPLT